MVEEVVVPEGDSKLGYHPATNMHPGETTVNSFVLGDE